MEVACGIMFNKSRQILMGLRPDNAPMGGYWEFPGGQLEEGETIEECLKREWIEELNLNINIDRELVSFKSNGYLCRFFIGEILDENNIKQNVHTELGFYKIDEIKKLNLFEEDYAIVEILSKKFT